MITCWVGILGTVEPRTTALMKKQLLPSEAVFSPFCVLSHCAECAKVWESSDLHKNGSQTGTRAAFVQRCSLRAGCWLERLETKETANWRQKASWSRKMQNEVAERRYSQYALHWNAGRRNTIWQQHSSWRAVFFHFGLWPSDQGLGSRSDQHVRGRETPPCHPIWSWLRWPRITTEDSRRSYSYFWGGAAAHWAEEWVVRTDLWTCVYYSSSCSFWAISFIFCFRFFFWCDCLLVVRSELPLGSLQLSNFGNGWKRNTCFCKMNSVYLLKGSACLQQPADCWIVTAFVLHCFIDMDRSIGVNLSFFFCSGVHIQHFWTCGQLCHYSGKLVTHHTGSWQGNAAS